MSKDVNRKRILNLIGAAWDKCPGFRLGQLIVNSAVGCSVTPLFYAEDMELAVAVETFVDLASTKVPESIITKKDEPKNENEH